MTDRGKKFQNIREVDRRTLSGDKLTEKGSRVISQGSENPPPAPNTPSASAPVSGSKGASSPPSGGKQ